MADVMTTPVIAVRETTPSTEPARIMTERKVGALPVMDTADLLAGAVSEADLPLEEEHRDDPSGRRAPRFGHAHDSLVKVAGEWEQRSHIPIAVQLSQRVDGVVDHLTYKIDGTRRSVKRF